MNQYYEVLTVEYPQGIKREVFEFVDKMAMVEFECTGIEEYSMNESEVDNLLGEKSISGGLVEQSVLDLVDNQEIKSQRKYYFYQDQSDDQRNAELFAMKVLGEVSGIQIMLERSEVIDWNEDWKKYYEPINVSASFKILPIWFKNKVDESDKEILLYIDPGQGFGTGTHETTFMCLQHIESLCKQSNAKKLTGNVLDFGCGSGILGIASQLMGSYFCDYLDVDQAALDNTEVNLVNNNIKRDNYRLLRYEDKNNCTEYDLIFANILKDVLLDESFFLISKLKDNGFLILSGLLFDQKDEVISKYKKCGATILKASQKGDWVSLVMTR